MERRDGNIGIKSASMFPDDRKFFPYRPPAVSRKSEEEKMSGLLLLIPTAFIPAHPGVCVLLVPTNHTRGRPRWGVQVWINTSPSEASVLGEGWSEATCREARLLSHCSAALNERSGVPPSMLDWAEIFHMWPCASRCPEESESHSVSNLPRFHLFAQTPPKHLVTLIQAKPAGWGKSQTLLISVLLREIQIKETVFNLCRLRVLKQTNSSCRAAVSALILIQTSCQGGGTVAVPKPQEMMAIFPFNHRTPSSLRVFMAARTGLWMMFVPCGDNAVVLFQAVQAESCILGAEKNTEQLLWPCGQADGEFGVCCVRPLSPFTLSPSVKAKLIFKKKKKQKKDTC